MLNIIQEDYNIMDTSPKRPRGGQPDNHNARKHGFYSRAFKRPDRSNFEDAARVAGLDQEISLLRAQLKIVLQRDPENARLIAHIASTLARLMRTNSKLPHNTEQNMAIAGLNILAQLNGVTLEELVEKVWEKVRGSGGYIPFDGPNDHNISDVNPFVSPEK